MSVTATSATGTCHGPTIGSREHRPPTVRSPIVTRNVLSATAGSCSTRYAASSSVDRRRDRAAAACARRARTSRVILGGLPRMHVERHVDRAVAEVRVARPRAGLRRSRVPTTANGQRSRSHIARERGRASPARSRARSAPAPRCTRSRAATCPALRDGTARRSNVPPAPPPCTSSGSAFDRPPAPTSWIDRIGLRVARAASSGRSLPARGARSRRCRAAPNRSRGRPAFAPVAIDDAAPPPMPISMPGPPSWMSSAPAGSGCLCVCVGADVADAARDHDRLVIAAHFARRPPARTCGSSRRGSAGRTRC